MPTTFIRPIHTAGAKSNDCPVNLSLIGIRRTANTNQIKADHSAQTVRISRPGNPTTGQHRGRHHN